MPTSRRLRFRVVSVALAASVAAGAGPALAFDPNAAPAHGGLQQDGGPFALFKHGFAAYKKGRKEEAFQAYAGAAEQGHPGARWKLGRMLADGDGVAEDDWRAFQLFQDIVRAGLEPGTQNDAYVSNALVALAGYIRRGIPGSPVKADPANARDLYIQAASIFGDPAAQFELGRMMMAGEGGPVDVRQAGRWLNLSASKGHVGAQALLGQLLFQNGHTVEGLAYLTTALQRAASPDKAWIRPLHEEAFALATDDDRRTAMALAEQKTQ